MPGETGLGEETPFFVDGGVTHFGSGVHMLQLFANTCIVDTGDGVVLFDVGLELNGPRIVEEVRAITDEPVRYIIYGHGHADHAFGTPAILMDAEARGHPRPLIIANENVRKRFDRYQRMLPYHEHINRIQFGIPEGLQAFSRTFVYPDETYRDEMNLTCGGVTFELRHARGETDDATWVWIPGLETALVSDLWVWSCPNIGNPFKVQRYTREWAEALEQIASYSPRLMLPGHGAAISGKAEVADACSTVARALRFLDDQVVTMLNQGKWQEEILHSFEWPPEFAESPYLAPIYGHPYFIVQGLLRQYHGWFDGNASQVFPSRSSEVAAEVLKLSGGPEAVLERARKLERRGEAQLALHLVDLVLDAGVVETSDALEIKARLLQHLTDHQSSFIARNIFLAAVRRIQK